LSTTDAEYRKVKIKEELRLDGAKKVLFGDAGTFMHQDVDGSLTIEADVSIKLVNLQNQADGTLGGTPLLIKIDIGGTPYYWKIYPTVT